MQIVKKNRRSLARLMTVSPFLFVTAIARADDVPQASHHHAAPASQEQSCDVPTPNSALKEGFQGVQVETSDIGLFEQFFESVLRAPLVYRADHPQADRLRGYCYRGVLIVMRQDLRTARPTGWVQLNFRVPDATAVQREIEEAYRMSSVAQLAEADRGRIVRFRFKPDVMRGERKVERFEVGGPEGFMVGFDQDK